MIFIRQTHDVDVLNARREIAQSLEADGIDPEPEEVQFRLGRGLRRVRESEMAEQLSDEADEALWNALG